MAKQSYLFSLGVVTLLAASCSGTSEKQLPDDDVLLQIGDSVLTRSEVERRMMPGMTSSDSVAFLDAAVREWTTDMLLRDVASRNLPDPQDVERKVREYRNRLVIDEYRKTMACDNIPGIAEDSVKAYYERNSARMILSRPIVKGIYIKVPADAEHIDDVRSWVKSATPESVDKLEKYGLRSAMQYDYFADKWIDWRLLEDEIPYDFGNPDTFVSANPNFETERDGSVYLLHITDHMPSGSPMPYAYAATLIPEILVGENRRLYDARLINSLYMTALRENRLKEGSYSMRVSAKESNNKKNNIK